MDITMIDETSKVSESLQETIENLLNLAAGKLSLPEDTQMSLTFMENEAIHKINKEYRGVDRPTDVISFAIEESGDEEAIIFDEEEILPAFPRDLGDVMISIEKAREQAEMFGHSYERELGFLAVHGFLHINGFDHQTKEDEMEMFALQEAILQDYGLSR